jgi:hypothetical protein
MRLYSNTILSWTQTLHVFQIARLYTGRWHNYYFYKIINTKPIVLTTHSPIELLRENHQYYCYDKYYRDPRLETYGNSFEMVSVYNKKYQMCEEDWAHIPKLITEDDIIVVRNDLAIGYPSVVAPPFIPFPALQ